VRRIALVLPKDWLGSGLRLLCVPDRRLTLNFKGTFSQLIFEMFSLNHILGIRYANPS
jgi:hypothetical protein